MSPDALARVADQFERAVAELRACVEANCAAAKGAEVSAPRRYMRTRDVATLLGVTDRCVRRWRSDGLLPPALEIAGVVRWRPETIEAWLAEREQRSGMSDGARR